MPPPNLQNFDLDAQKSEYTYRCRAALTEHIGISESAAWEAAEALFEEEYQRSISEPGYQITEARTAARDALGSA